MSYLVMEVHPAYAVVLDEEGRFLKAANLQYQVGDTVQTIVELRQAKPRSPALWKPLSGLAAAAACLGNVFERVLTEIPAGKRETGEEPFLTAQRELKEEIGAEAGRWTELGALIASPGCYGETLYLYMAEDLTFGETHPDEDEFLEVLRVPFEEAVRQCMDGTLTDAKTVAAVLKGRLLRERACAPAADAIH